MQYLQNYQETQKGIVIIARISYVVRFSLVCCLLATVLSICGYSQVRIAGSALIKIDGYNTQVRSNSIETGLRLNVLPDVGVAIDWKLDKEDEFSFLGLGFWIRSTSVRSRLMNDGALLGQYFAPNIGLPDNVETYTAITELSIAPYIGIGIFYGGVIVGFPLGSSRTIQEFSRQQVNAGNQTIIVPKEIRTTTGAEVNVEPFLGARLPLHTSDKSELCLNIQAGFQLVASELIDVSNARDFLNAPIRTYGRSLNLGVGVSYFFEL